MKAFMLAVLGLGLPATGFAETPDPCDFASRPFLEYQQVLDCYQSIPFDPSDRDNQTEVFRRFLEFSDLRGTYNRQVGWRSSLRRLRNRAFSSDYEMVDAFRSFVLDFKNGHFAYGPPFCYGLFVFPYVPIGFGSKLVPAERSDRRHERRGRRRQAIYVSSTILSDTYEEATGIDVTPWVGREVVSIEGEDPIEFFRAYGRNELRADANDGVNLNVILSSPRFFSVRTSPLDPFPSQPALAVVLKDDDGQRIEARLPWIFLQSFPLGQSPFPAPSSSEEFAAACAAPNPFLAPEQEALTQARDATLDNPVEGPLRRYEIHDGKSVERFRRLERASASGDVRWAEGREGGIREIIPLTNGARVVEFRRNTTAIQLRETFSSDWREQVRQGASYACENSRNLIVDVRSNQGGRGDLIEWLARYFQPGTTDPADFALVFRELSRDPTTRELFTLANLAQAQGQTPPGCVTGFEPQCYADPSDRLPLSSPDWFQDPVIREVRGRRLELLTRLVSAPDGAFGIPANEFIPCPGRFQGKRLIILVNGVNASAGFFFPELVRDVSTIVSVGGILGEPLVTGRARGGATNVTVAFRRTQDALANATGVPPAFELPVFNRNVFLAIEFGGLYDDNFRDLYADAFPVADLQLPIWTNTPDTDGSVYRKVLRGVRRLNR